MKNTVRNSICALITSGALVFAGTGIASADVSVAERVPLTSKEMVNQEDIDRFAQDVELLFTRYVPQINGTYTVNEMAIIADGYAGQIDVFRTLASNLNLASEKRLFVKFSSSHHGEVATYGADSYVMCVVAGALGIPATALSAATWASITTAIAAWNWGLAASTIVRALGPAFVTSFGKALGGPVLVASALAVAAVSCAFS